MKIAQYPPFYASAFGDVNFQVSATADEILEIDILANDRTTVIGKKRFTGSTLYKVNIAGYARQQLEVTPQRTGVTSFAFPPKRITGVTLRSGNFKASTIVAAGVKVLQAYEKLSQSPDIIPISASQRDELSLILDEGIPLSAEARFSGIRRNAQLTVVDETEAGGVTTLCLNMPDIAKRLQSASLGTLEDYHTMEVGLMIGPDQLLSQCYRLTKDTPGQVRLCWWNYCGQIDYYTMKRVTQQAFEVNKNRVYMQEGYKTIRSEGTTSFDLVSEYETEETMQWICQMVASPRVWIDKGTRIEPIEIISKRVVTSSTGLSRLEINVEENPKTVFQHL